MDTKALRQKILDLAIRGKLVPQDPNDEPASVLLDRIRAEKQQMVKDGKLKAKDIKNDTVIFKGEDNLHYEKFADGTVKCIEDEIPFEVPEGWAWARVATICFINPRNSIDDNLCVSFIPMILIQDGFSNSHTSENKEWKAVKTGFTHFAEKDIAVAKITPCFENRKSVVLTNLCNGYGAGTTELHILRTINNTILPEYLLWNVKTDAFICGGVQNFSGAVGQQRVGKDFIASYFIPIPPFLEQERIVNKVNALFSIIDTIESNKTDLKSTIQLAKSKILDLAIRGKLVPQDPNDEPASVLLERIRTEKEELIKQGKIKRDKNESLIFRGEDNSYYEKIGDTVRCIDDEVPFEIPENWIWCRLKNISDIVMGASPSGNNINNDSQYTEFHQGKIFFSDLFINKSGQYTKEVTKTALPNSVLLCVRAPVGEVNITDRLICIGRGLAAIRPLNLISEHFIFYWLYAFRSTLTAKATGTTFTAVTSDVVKELLIPLPPLSYQNRILLHIQDTVNCIQKIERSLS